MRQQYVPVEQNFILYAGRSYKSSNKRLGCLAMSKLASCSTMGLALHISSALQISPETGPLSIIHTYIQQPISTMQQTISTAHQAQHQEAFCLLEASAVCESRAKASR